MGCLIFSLKLNASCPSDLGHIEAANIVRISDLSSDQIVTRLVFLCDKPLGNVGGSVAAKRYILAVSKIYLYLTHGPLAEVIKVPPDPVREEKELIGILERRGFLHELREDPHELLAGLEYVSMEHPSRSIRNRAKRLLDTYDYLIFLGKVSIPTTRIESQWLALMRRVRNFSQELNDPATRITWELDLLSGAYPERYYQWVLGDLTLAQSKLQRMENYSMKLNDAVEFLQSIWRSIHPFELTPMFNPITEQIQKAPAYELSMPYNF